jgi:hypothetical protein
MDHWLSDCCVRSCPLDMPTAVLLVGAIVVGAIFLRLWYVKLP